MTRKFVAVPCLILLNLTICTVWAFDDQDTHPRITKEAVSSSNLDTYLNQNLGFTFGSLSVINGKPIIKILREGSTAEDSLHICRASNHFHNPLLSWDQSYMSDDTTVLGSLIRTYCNLTGWPYSDRKSNVTWGTGYLSPSPSGTKVTISNQQWGWDNARMYYLNALTAPTNTDRGINFSKTFQALGQVLHLIEDGAQPMMRRLPDED